MIDVLFTHSYFLRFDPKEYASMMPYPPLGTLYAASTARQRGYRVALFDSMLAEHEADILPVLSTHHPSIVVIYDDDFNYLTKMCLTRMREAAFRISEYAHRAGCTVVVHGSDPVDHLEEYFSHHASFVICGEGEQTLTELLDALLARRGDPSAIAGLAFMRDGRVIRTSPRAVMKNLDALPFPAWDLLDGDHYRSVWTSRHGYYSTNMVTTRGCPFHCNWCAKPLYGQVYNSRTPENVVEEMIALRDALKPDHIWFCDDIFGLKPGWIAAFSEEVIRRGVKTPFKCLARVDLLVKDHMVENLRRAGCVNVWVGAESGSQKILDAMEKGTTVEQIREATRLLKDAGIRVGFFLQYGYPGETRGDIDLTLGMVRDCRPDDIGISVSYPLPGTRFYERVRASLGEKHNWVDSQDLDLMFPGAYPPEFYRLLHRVTHKRFRMWQGLGYAAEALHHPSITTVSRLRRMASVVFHAITLPRLTARLDAFDART
jgi:radical SAM superfamily enzyme YgiQ (UPF0313 family)